jgi:hypothetical protein
MGAAPLKPSIPARPFERNPYRHRSCLASSLLLPPTRKQHHTTNTLLQLILLQDWQRVLIRCSLFPHEITQPAFMAIHGLDWKLLPLHLACALNPPPAVVKVLLNFYPNAATLPLERRWKTKPRFSSWVARMRKRVDDDRIELLGTDWQENDYYCNDDPSVVSRMTTNGGARMTKNHLYTTQGSLVSLEQSIGDASVNESSCCDNKTLDGASLGSFLDKQRIVLQLSPSGGILPMQMPNALSKETASTSETSGLDLPRKELLHEASSSALLPIHIACLYQASPSVIQLLLEEHSMGGLSPVVGMLPVHLVAARWILEPLLLPTPPFSFPESASMESATSIAQLLQLLIQALPETLVARSAHHAMTPTEYVEETMADGAVKDVCLKLLHIALKEYKEGGNQSIDSGG